MNRFFFVSFVSIFFLIVCCTSCFKEIVNERVDILIHNRTDSLIHVTLYPKRTASTTPDLYLMCDDGCGYQQTKFYLPSNNQKILFRSNDLSVEPYTLAAKAFDSIYISSTNILIKFLHEDVTTYSENIFSENSTWNFSIEEYHARTQFTKIITWAHTYRFLILKEKIVIEKNKEEKNEINQNKNYFTLCCNH